jgi:uncharacterized membrane protein
MIRYLPELLKADVITQDIADAISDYYRTKKGQGQNRLFVVFGILGALLVGLGIILIIAHNWDTLSRYTKSMLAFTPLIAGQILCGYVLVKKSDNIVWRESTTTFLIFAVGACISLISQIYQISGNLGEFLLIWILLCLPLIYIMRSSIASLLSLIGITFYACQIGYWTRPPSESYIYLLLICSVLPHYYSLYKNKPESNYMTFHNWIIPLSLIITLGIISKNNGELMYIAYFSLFGLFLLIGDSPIFNQYSQKNTGYLILGNLGTVVLLLMLSFNWYWTKTIREHDQTTAVLTSPEFITALLLSIASLIWLVRKYKFNVIQNLKPVDFIFAVFIITYFIGLLYPTVSIIVINLVVLLLGISVIINGAKSNHLGILNYGLMIIVALVICRYFDSNLSYVTRGILFVLVGAGFFYANYWMLQKRKTYEK